MPILNVENKKSDSGISGLVDVQQLTIFFFCLDPSLQTKTTAVLNTTKKSNENVSK